MNEERIPTTQILAKALREAGAPPAMIRNAENGYYDDYKSDLALPINQLVVDAKKLNLNSIAERAMSGDFDAQDWEAEAWAASEDGQSTFRELAAGLPKMKLKPGEIEL